MNEIRNKDLIFTIVKTITLLMIITGTYFIISKQKSSIDKLSERADSMKKELQKRDTVLFELRTHIAYYEHLHINCHKIKTKKNENISKSAE